MNRPAAAVPTSTQTTPAPRVLGRAASQKIRTTKGLGPGYGRFGKASKFGLRFSR